MIGARFWSVFHFILLIILLFWNYIANSGSLPYTMGELSAKYPTLFTPAPYAFAIWGVIYLGLIALGVYMLYAAFKKDFDDDFIRKSATYLSVAYIGMTAWLWFWGNDMVLISLACMIVILISLILCVLRLRMELWDAPVHFMALVWWPIDLLFGWICVATVANISIYLYSIGWNGMGISALHWTFIAIGLVIILGLFLIATRNMREVGAVFIWALAAIAYKQWDLNSEIAYLAIAGIVTLGVYSSIHAMQNQYTLPHNKIKRGEW
jgi:hypothetical protein